MGVAKLIANNAAACYRIQSAAERVLKPGDISRPKPNDCWTKMYDQLSDLMNRLSSPGTILLHLINEILDVAKIGIRALVIEAYGIARLQNIVDRVIEQLNTLSSKKGLALT